MIEHEPVASVTQLPACISSIVSPYRLSTRLIVTPARGWLLASSKWIITFTVCVMRRRRSDCLGFMRLVITISHRHINKAKS